MTNSKNDISKKINEAAGELIREDVRNGVLTQDLLAQAWQEFNPIVSVRYWHENESGHWYAFDTKMYQLKLSEVIAMCSPSVSNTSAETKMVRVAGIYAGEDNIAMVNAKGLWIVNIPKLLDLVSKERGFILAAGKILKPDINIRKLEGKK